MTVKPSEVPSKHFKDKPLKRSFILETFSLWLSTVWSERLRQVKMLYFHFFNISRCTTLSRSTSSYPPELQSSPHPVVTESNWFEHNCRGILELGKPASRSFMVLSRESSTSRRPESSRGSVLPQDFVVSWNPCCCVLRAWWPYAQHSSHISFSQSTQPEEAASPESYALVILQLLHIESRAGGAQGEHRALEKQPLWGSVLWIKLT